MFHSSTARVHDRRTRTRRLAPAFAFVLAAAAMTGGLQPARAAEQDSAVPAGSTVAGLAFPGSGILYKPAAVAESMLDRTTALGAGWVRFDAAFAEMSPERGTIKWSGLDRLVQAARDRGLKVLLAIGTTPSWARPAGTDWNHGPVDEAGRATFRAFAVEAATRYRGKVAAYEIWNEPNLGGSWNPQPSPAAYLSLLSTTSAGIRSADPDADVISGGTGPSEPGEKALEPLPWYRALYAGGLRSMIDGVAVHPWPHSDRVDVGEMAQSFEIRKVMDANGDATKLIWGTETGVPTAGAYSITESAQAAVIPKLYDRWNALPHHGPLFYYTLTDNGGTNREDAFGLLRVNGSEKPAFGTLKTWISSNR
ncbi:cellulase family glycosylhydrolase [Actinoplanes sp. GCM10030250]|uniref:cellulase family glycosylhydrolase n=1 Tax=Actinoplanes sp. GCM10030250 TaxID=3273376 RepID=UPI00360965F9